jgi:hypothetical protein
MPDGLQKYMIGEMLEERRGCLETLGLYTGQSLPNSIRDILTNGSNAQIAALESQIKRWRINDTYYDIFAKGKKATKKPFLEKAWEKGCNKILKELEEDVRYIAEIPGNYNETEFYFNDFLIGNYALRQIRKKEFKEWIGFMKEKMDECAGKGMGKLWFAKIEYEPEKKIEAKSGTQHRVWPLRASRAKVTLYDNGNNSVSFDVPEELNSAVYAYWLRMQMSDEKVIEELQGRKKCA